MISKKMKMVSLAATLSVCALAGVATINHVNPMNAQTGSNTVNLTAEVEIKDAAKNLATISCNGATDLNYKDGYDFTYTVSNENEKLVYSFDFTRDPSLPSFKLMNLSRATLLLNSSYVPNGDIPVTLEAGGETIVEKTHNNYPLTYFFSEPVSDVTSFKLTSTADVLPFIDFIDFAYICEQ